MKAIGRPKHNILAALARFDYLSAPQLTRLVFGTNVLTYVRDHLKELHEGEYVQRLYLPSFSPRGRALTVHCLNRKGLSYLKKAGITPPTRFSPSDRAEREWMFLQHTLAANDLLIQCHLFERGHPESQLCQFATERQLKRSPVITRIEGKRVKVIFDGWVHLQYHWPGREQPSNYYIAFELDRGTVEQRAFRRKIQFLLAMIDQGYREHFQAPGLTIAFVTTSTTKRLNDMVKWTELELNERKKRGYGALFLFSQFEPADIADTVLAFDPIWLQPFSDQKTALLVPPHE